MPAAEKDIKQDDTDGSFRPSEPDLPQVRFFLTPHSPLFFFFLLTGLATAQYLCAVCLQPVSHSPLSHESFSGRSDKKQTYQCYYAPGPVFQYHPIPGEYIGAKWGASP